MFTQIAEHCIAFEGERCISRGGLIEVAKTVHAILGEREDARIYVFDDVTAHIVEIDMRGSEAEMIERLRQRLRAQPAENGTQPLSQRGPGRPKLGVVSREVTLLPRHWEWLGNQPGGASITLRKLVEAARKQSSGKDRIRSAQEAVYRFMNAMAGDLPGYEEALRALYAADRKRFDRYVDEWPSDIRDHVHRLSVDAFGTIEE